MISGVDNRTSSMYYLQQQQESDACLIYRGTGA